MRAVVLKLLAVSDLHVSFPENREIVANLWPESAGDRLMAAGDVGEIVVDIEWALRTLRERFAAVVWVPGNHELWTHREDPVQLRGEARYRHLVEGCRGLCVVTPVPYPVWEGAGGPVTIADGVRFEEVSYGYPRVWHLWGSAPGPLRQILPIPGSTGC